MKSVSARTLLQRSWSRCLVVGHRGAADEAPENTLAAFEAGIASGAPAVECDVQLSADGELVVIHDATLDRTTSLKGPVEAMPGAAIREAGVPSLEEVVRLTKGRCVLVVEIKSGLGIEAKVLDLLRREGTLDETIVFAFQDEPIRAVKALAPELIAVRLLLLSESFRVPKASLARLLALGADGVGIDYRRARSRFVRTMREAGLPVFSWTVPPGSAVDRLERMGVNFVITNDPRTVEQRLGAERPS